MKGVQDLSWEVAQDKSWTPILALPKSHTSPPRRPSKRIAEMAWQVNERTENINAIKLSPNY
jgi:hypothetical protein